MGGRNSTPQDQTVQQPDITFENPWRPVNWRDKEPMVQTLREFQSEHHVDHLRILVVGPIRAEKSAFITSVNTALQGRCTYLAHSLSGGLSVTCKYTVYKLNKGTKGSFFPFVFADTMGLETGFSGAHVNDIINILQGHIQEGYTFNPLTPLTAESNNYNPTPNLNDKVHCLVFVLPADKVAQICDGITDKMKKILQQAQELGIPQVVIMSKVDVACSLVKQDLKMIYKSTKIKVLMEECSIKLGVPMRQIFPVKNYHEEIITNTEIDILILTAVTSIVNFASDFVQASEKPWRPVNWSDKEPMLQRLREFQPNRHVDHIRILVVGPAGAGKSAFITSVNTALQGRNTYLAHSLSGDSSVTHKYTVYKLNKGTEGTLFPFVFSDTMGLEELGGTHVNDIINILQGHIHEGYTFDPSTPLTAESNDYNPTPNLNDNIHCLVFVLPADNVLQISDGIMDKMKEIRKKAQELGIPQVVIMSKVDVACSLVNQNLRTIYMSKKIRERMKECSISLGLQMTQIFPVKNYHEEITNNTEVDILILTAVTNIVNFASDFVNRKVQNK
ncbi:uncharacterized protein LOC132866365 isoform X3 [Neoarius graeffei]|uniref:uncharacterized protein LOC132866365 isoform X3 n=1 Tax=Neoarius graeffei TaxID=443677 RepID=UPI00298C4689|nr:uncharacterized protein LOC132866365 isoform X3 [Neoarius graeffei]